MEKHFEKHITKKGTYNFKSKDEYNNYAQAFFARAGKNINEFTDADGFVHRIDIKTQEYGILTPDGGIQTVFKVQPKANSSFKNATDYLENKLMNLDIKNLNLMEKNKTYQKICPICGASEALDGLPYVDKFVLCSCCFFHFGIDDKENEPFMNAR